MKFDEFQSACTNGMLRAVGEIDLESSLSQTQVSMYYVTVALHPIVHLEGQSQPVKYL